jgi:PAS domain S-box-containing protein
MVRHMILGIAKRWFNRFGRIELFMSPSLAWLKPTTFLPPRRNVLYRVWRRICHAAFAPGELSDNILHQLDSGVVVVSADGATTLVNTAAANLFDAEVSTLTGKPMQEVLPESLVGPLMETMVEQKSYQHHETTLHLTSGLVVPIEFSTVPLYAKSGRLVGACLMLHDLSHVIETEAEKRRAERLASIGAFVSGIAHEIKNPLVAIKALAELLPEQYDDEEFRQTFSQVALYEVERIDDLVKRLRSLGAAPPSRRSCISILEPLEETLALLSGELIRRGITLDYVNEFSPPAIIGDTDQLKQVFLNLCLNSIEAMQQGGVLRVSLRTDTVTEAESGRILIHISDTGPGLPQTDLRRIFDPFVTTKTYGSGLGLAICKAIIEHHNGTIDAMNRRHGSGAQFIVSLPVDYEEDTYEVVTPRRRPARTVNAVA